MEAVTLKTEGLTRKFGALVAVDNVDLIVREGTIHALIGPNGAGKTTLFNLVTGELRPTSGRIVFNGKDITGMPPHKISHLGIGRSYQITNVFPQMTVLENLQLAVQSRTKENYRLLRDASKLREVTGKACRIAEVVGLGSKLHEKASDLPHGDRKALDIGIALATDPSLLLLDEPTSGMPAQESKQVMNVIVSLSEEVTIVLIEHKMEIVLSVSDIITVMHEGKIIAEGTPEVIKRNPEVKRAYLGGAVTC